MAGVYLGLGDSMSIDTYTGVEGGGAGSARRSDRAPESIERIAARHRSLLDALRAGNPEARIVVGNIYAPQIPLPKPIEELLDLLNARISANVGAIGANLADIRSAFRGREDRLLCMEIEPTLEGATVIADLFRSASARTG